MVGIIFKVNVRYQDKNMKKAIIFVVDDQPINLTVLGEILTVNGYATSFASDGKAALDAIKIELPDLILLDVMMPGIDGFEVCRQLKQDATVSDIPIIFLTAETQQNSVIAGLELGAVDYVTKPFNEKELITRIQTHLELQSVKKALQEALAAKEKFVSIIAHDLYHLFHSLVTLGARLAEHKIPLSVETKDSHIQRIFQFSKKGYTLLENLLEWSRTQMGKMPINPEIINLQSLIDKNIELQGVNVKNINTHIGDDALSVFADKNMLDTVIRNLLSNAVKFTPTQGIIQIYSKKVRDKVEISVSDTGEGIAPEDIDTLFQIDRVPTTFGAPNKLGKGLGLILCKELVEKNGGTINVKSEMGNGSTFYFCLPSQEPK